MAWRTRGLWFGRAMAFGVCAALAFHFLHGPTEADAYIDAAHFLFHLAVEGLIVLYGTVVGLAVQGVVARLRR